MSTVDTSATVATYDGSFSAPVDHLAELLETRKARVGIIGLGYVGLPLAVEVGAERYSVLGFDVSDRVVAGINSGSSHVQDIASDRLVELSRQGRLEATAEMNRLGECDAISICVPTPLNKIKDPDLSYVVEAASRIRDTLRPGQLVILESTTYPGTTRDIVLPILQESGLEAGKDFFLCFSPERVDPGNTTWHTKNTPKVLGGVTAGCLAMGELFYGSVFDCIVPVESAEAAELVKVYENTFRMINIALANELAQVCDKLGVDVWGVIDAAATKPFGFMKFTPGPGLGGHCIPLDPHYLSWKMRTLAYRTRMIELASGINGEMPGFVVQKVTETLNDEGKAVRGAIVLILGIAYKKDVDDVRESPALDVIRLLQLKGAIVGYHDPHCPVINHDGHTELEGLPMTSRALVATEIAKTDVVVIVTDHAAVDYRLVVDSAKVVVDTRGVLRRMDAVNVVPLGGKGRA